MSTLLDVVRALAAFVVLAGHAVGFHLYNGPYPFELSARHNAVMVFFVLSGLVITHSVQSRAVTLAEYATARIMRIFPMTVLAVGFSFAVALYGATLGIEFSEPGPSFANVILPLLFLSEGPFGSGLVWNPPFWSLAYEAMYYALFGVAVFSRSRVRWLLLGLLVLLAGIKVLLLLPVWLMGVLLARSGDRLEVRLPLGIVLIGAGIGLVMVATRHAAEGTLLLSGWTRQTPEQLGFSNQALSDLFVGLGVVLGFVGLRPVAQLLESVLESWRRVIQVMADLSFPVYILHLPMLVLLAAFGVNAGSSLIAFAALLAAIIAACAAISTPVQRRSVSLRPKLARWLEKLLEHSSLTDELDQPSTCSAKIVSPLSPTSANPPRT